MMGLADQHTSMQNVQCERMLIATWRYRDIDPGTGIEGDYDESGRR